MIEPNACESMRQFCRSMLRVLDDRESRPVLDHGLPTLVQALAAGSHSTVSRLRTEIERWDAASETLRQLAVSQNLFGEEAAALLHKLRNARERAVQIAETLESLPFAAATYDGPSETPPPVAFAGSNRRIEPTTEPSEIFDAPSDDHVIHLFASSSARRRAAELIREADAARDEKKFSVAEALYAETLALDPDHRAAYMHRGRIRLLDGRHQEAVSDFDRALELDDNDDVAFWWRGDANALAANFVGALADYTRALEIRPELVVVRYNRAVALREMGHLAAAIQEFDRLIDQEPAHAPLYLNRGLIWMEHRDWSRAAAEFRIALKLRPDSLEALKRLQEAEDHLHRMTPEEVEGPLPLVEARSPSPQQDNFRQEKALSIEARSLALQSATATEEPPSQTAGDQTPAAETVTDQNAAKTDKSVRLNFQCPGCGLSSAVRWDKLKMGKVLGCPHCQKRFTTKCGGRIVEVVKDQHDRWVDIEWRDAQLQKVRTKRKRMAGFTVTVGLLGLALFWTPAIVRGLSTSETPLPTELEPRAELFARSWLKGDTSMMRRLTDPVQDRLLFTWYRRNPAPKLRDRDANLDEAKIELHVTPGKNSGATVRIRFVELESERTRLPIELNSTWQDRGGTWSFHPSTIAKSRTGT